MAYHVVMARLMIVLVLLAGAAGMLGGCVQAWPEPEPENRVVFDLPVFCYISLAQRECYAGPIPGDDYRLASAHPSVR